MKESTVKVILQALTGAIAVAFALSAIWLIWLVWTFVAFSVWPDGPAGLVNPGYWLFVAEWAVLIGFLSLLRTVFVRK